MMNLAQQDVLLMDPPLQFNIGQSSLTEQPESLNGMAQR